MAHLQTKNDNRDDDILEGVERRPGKAGLTGILFPGEGIFPATFASFH